MKSISIFALVVAFACSALFVSSANAGGRRGTLGASSSGASSSGVSTSAASATVYPTGRSPLGEPVFLIPATSTSGTNGGPIGGYVGPRTPLPPLKAPPSNTVSLPSVAQAGGQGTGVARVQPDRSTRVIFTPPPTFVGVAPAVDGAATAAVTNRAVVDRTFGPSMLDTGLSAAGGQAPWVRITPLQYSAPVGQVPANSHATVTTQKPGAIVELPTSASSTATTAASAAAAPVGR